MKRIVRTLLSGIVDYAGLFPPAALGMREAAAAYAGELEGDWSWMLGRFVVPSSRLGEFEQAAGGVLPRSPASRQWRLSLLAGEDLAADAGLLSRFNRDHRDRAVIDTVEMKARQSEEITRAAAILPKTVATYVEVPAGGDPSGLIAAIASVGVRAKLRTGGVTAEAFPASADLVNFIALCAGVRVPMKATAGLHHPVRARYRLTYDEQSATGMMFGFLNLFLAAAFILQGMERAAAVALIEEQSPEAFRVTENAIAWRHHTLTEDDIMKMRTELAVAFGSCSFREPIDELRSLHWL